MSVYTNRVIVPDYIYRVIVYSDDGQKYDTLDEFFTTREKAEQFMIDFMKFHSGGTIKFESVIVNKIYNGDSY